MNYTIRNIKETEYPLLNDFIYEAIFVPEGAETPAKSIINNSDIQVYIEGFGSKPDDCCVVAEAENDIVAGAAWVRMMNDYGHVDNETPSLAIAVYKQYRGLGMGTAMLKELLSILKTKGYKRTSLAVQKANDAAKLYRQLGYEIIGENKEEYIMVKYL